MRWKDEWKWVVGLSVVFLVLYFLPIGIPRFDNAILESLMLAKWYMREHVLLCLIPALFIAGAVSAFVSQTSVMKYFGAQANKVLAYAVASVSGTILAVCSCTILPLFAGIYKRGAGLGPAIAFLYSGPAINILAIVLTARVLGFEMGVARAIGAIVFSVVIGLAMHLLFLQEEMQKSKDQAGLLFSENDTTPWQRGVLFASLCAILVFSNWNKGIETSGFFYSIYSVKWVLTSFFAVVFAMSLVVWFRAKVLKITLASSATVVAALLFPGMPSISFCVGFIGLSWSLSGEEGELNDWLEATWSLSKQIFPLLIAGVLFSGFLLGSPGKEGVIPSAWISRCVGSNSLAANMFSSVVAAFMYFATLTEIPILQGLMDNGMDKGPALALLLAGPSLSLPSMLVLKSIMGTKKTVAYVGLVILMSTITGKFYGAFF